MPTVTLAAAFLLVGCQPQMSEIEAQKTLVLDVFAAIDAQDFDRLRELWPEDAPCYMVGAPGPLDRETVFGMIQQFYASFPDNTHELGVLVAEGNKVVVQVTNNGTHQGEFEGLPPTGAEIRYEAVHIITFEDGQIAEWWALEDNLGFMQQMGMIPAGG
jgi:steroid delta-isomerase-like uncharacterized protein